MELFSIARTILASQDLAYSFLANNNMCMVWSLLAGIRTPPIATTDFLYIRFIGDRTIVLGSFRDEEMG
jgi:hypothetical protein